MASKFETSKESGIHHQLSRMAGEWEGVTKTYFEEGVVTDESPVTGTIKPILGGRFMLHEYQGSLQGKPLEGVAIIGHYLDLGKYQTAWVDSFHMSTGILFSESSESTNKISSVSGSYAAGPEVWGWQTEIEMPGDDELIIKHSNRTPDGEPAGGVEMIYKRK